MAILLHLLSLSIAPVGVHSSNLSTSQGPGQKNGDILSPCPRYPATFGLVDPQLSLFFRHRSDSGTVTQRSASLGLRFGANFGVASRRALPDGCTTSKRMRGALR